MRGKRQRRSAWNRWRRSQRNPLQRPGRQGRRRLLRRRWRRLLAGPSGGSFELASYESTPTVQISFSEGLPSPLEVVTGAASEVTSTSAVLNATVNPNGAEVSKCNFQYGTTEAYSSTAPCSPSPGSGESSVAVSAAVGSLSANITYRFRIVATNSGGTSYGSDQTFATLPAGPAPKITKLSEKRVQRQVAPRLQLPAQASLGPRRSSSAPQTRPASKSTRRPRSPPYPQQRQQGPWT